MVPPGLREAPSLSKYSFLDSRGSVLFFDRFSNKTTPFLLLVAAILAFRAMHYRLAVYAGDYLLLKPLVWFFTPYWDISLSTGILMMAAGFFALGVIEYFLKKIIDTYSL